MWVRVRACVYVSMCVCVCVFIGTFVVTTLKSGECFGEEWLLGHDEVRCSVLQCVAVCCSVSQCAALC